MNTQRDFNRSRSVFTQNSTAQGGNKQPSGGIGKSLIALWVAAFVMFSFGGVGIVVGVVLILSAVIGLLVWVAKKAADAKGESSGTVPAYTRPMQQSFTRPQMPAPATQSDHLCESGQHAEENRGSTDTLNDMQQGYGDYSATRNRQSGYLPESSFSGITPNGRMTRDQYQKKTQELRSLVDAGIITQEEYRAKMNEYSRFVV